MSDDRPHRARIRPDLFRVYRALDPTLLGATDAELSPDDVALEKTEGRVDRAFGVYSQEGLHRALDAYGTLRRLAERGVGELRVRLLLDDPFRPRIQFWSAAFGAPVVDVVLSLTTGSAVGLPAPFRKEPLLSLESLLLQHPGRRFDWSRPPLPGQSHPGLSLSGEVLDLLLLIARRLHLEGLVLTPMSFHAARVYQKHFCFIDGRAQGTFRALREAGSLRPLWLTAWALEVGAIRADGTPFEWQPTPMLAPLTERLSEVFSSPQWREGVAATRRQHFEIDFPRLRERFPWQKMPEGTPPLLVSALLKRGSGP